jgi:hypothetical protein
MANYPSSASSDSNLYVAVNSLATSLVGALTSSGGNNGADIEVTSTANFPSVGFITIDQEAIKYTSLLSGPPRFSGITRGADGTIAASHAASTTVKHNVIAAHHNALKDEVIAVETDLTNSLGAPNEAATLASTASTIDARFDQVFTQLKNISNQSLTTAAKTYANLFSYRRPNLRYGSTTTVDIENIPVNSGQRTILFPDGDYRIDSTSSHITFDITRNAVLNGSNQSGLRTSLSEATNTWYAIYAVKEQNASGFVLVGDTLLPVIGNLASLNTNFGTNSWVYLGLIRNGDNNAATGDILRFCQNGNFTVLSNRPGGGAAPGTVLASTAGATSITYTYSAGTGTTNIPDNIGIMKWYAGSGGTTTTEIALATQTSTNSLLSRFSYLANNTSIAQAITPAVDGAYASVNVSCPITIYLSGFFDNALGVGSNPLV